MLKRSARTRSAFALIALAAVGLGSVSAPAGPVQTVVVIAGSTYIPGDNYFPSPTLVIPKGSSMTFVNAGPTVNHTLTSEACTANGAITSCDQAGARPLFDSGDVKQFKTAPVQGIETLPAGTYPFFCLVHPGISGTLVVI